MPRHRARGGAAQAAAGEFREALLEEGAADPPPEDVAVGVDVDLERLEELHQLALVLYQRSVDPSSR